MLPGDPRFLDHYGLTRTGVDRSVRVNSPAAGADWSVQVPGGVTWHVLGGTALLTTSGAAANRNPRLVLSQNGIVAYVGLNTFNLAAGLAATYVLCRQSPPILTAQLGAFVQLPVADLLLDPGDTVQVVTTGIDVADQWSAISLSIDEYYFTDNELADDSEQRDRDREEVMAAIAAGGVELPPPPS